MTPEGTTYGNSFKELKRFDTSSVGVDEVSRQLLVIYFSNGIFYGLCVVRKLSTIERFFTMRLFQWSLKICVRMYKKGINVIIVGSSSEVLSRTSSVIKTKPHPSKNKRHSTEDGPGRRGRRVYVVSKRASICNDVDRLSSGLDNKSE